MAYEGEPGAERYPHQHQQDADYGDWVIVNIENDAVCTERFFSEQQANERAAGLNAAGYSASGRFGMWVVLTASDLEVN